MSQAALNRTITQLQGAVQARIANEQAFKVRIYNEINTILARLRQCAVVAASAPPGPAASAALVDLNREIGLVQTEVGHLQNNLLDENDATDVMNTVRREAPNIRFDTAANMNRFARAPPPYVYPGPGRPPVPLAGPPASASGLLGALGLSGVFGSSSASGSGSASGAVGSAGADGADGADGAGRRRVGAIGSADDVDLGEDGYPIGSGLPADFNPGLGTDPFPPPPAYPGPAYNGPGPWGPGGADGPGGAGGPRGPGGAGGPRSGGWTPKRKTPKRKPKKKSVRR
jgi:hypothetical protein